MLSFMRNRFGIPGVISVVALVFAMFGGAYAANKSQSTASKAKAAKGKRGPRGPKGPQGPAGAQGPAGPTGPAGATGAAGKEGPRGPKGEAGPLLETLPAGKTLKGTWGVGGSLGAEGGSGRALVEVSFQFPVSPAPTVYYMPDNSFGIKIPQTGPVAVSLSQEELEEFEDACPGTPAEPEATAGNLCIYAGEEEDTIATVSDFFNGGASETLAEKISRASTLGAVIPLQVQSELGYARGAWAVTR